MTPQYPRAETMRLRQGHARTRRGNAAFDSLAPYCGATVLFSAVPALAQQKTLTVAAYGGVWDQPSPQGGDSGVREEARREGRVRRRQLDGYAGQAAGPEEQPGDRRRHHGRRRRCIRRSSSASARHSGPGQERSSTPAALFKDDKAVAVGQTGTGFMINTKVFKDKGLGDADFVERPQGSEIQEAARDPADQQHLRALHAHDVRAA